MTQTIPYWHVDAFAAQPFGGNQAAVMVLDEWLPDDVLVAIGAENLFAETAFVVRDATGAADWELRWCTPTYEIALCGHATLASGHFVLGRDSTLERVRFRTRKAGVLEVVREDNGYAMALPAYPPAPAEVPGLLAALGVTRGAVLRHANGYDLVVLERAEDVLALRPDFRAMAAIGDTLNIVTAPGRDTDVVSRVFAPAAGIDEDPVTGSAHSVLTPYWAARLGRNRFSAFQASKRGGHVDCEAAGDRVILRGRCVTVIEGVFTL